MSWKRFAVCGLAAACSLAMGAAPVAAQGTVGGFSSADIGAVGQPGATSQSDGTFAISGAGADIWGTSDAFRFVYETVIGDAIIGGQVISEQNTSPFAKTGFMIRQSLDPSAPHVIIDVKPDGGIEFMTRSFAGGETRFISGVQASFPIYLRLTRKGTTVTAAYRSGCCSAYTDLGSTTWTNTAALAGMAVTSHDPSVLNRGIIDAPYLSRLLPPWTDTVFYTRPASDQPAWSWDGDRFQVDSRGSDIWGAFDSFEYVSQPFTGDAEIVARVVSETGTNPFAKAGVMMRGNLGGDVDGGDPDVILDVKPDGGVEFMSRPTAKGDTNFIAAGFTSFPAWLKLTKNGNQYTGFVLNNGTWTMVGSTTADLSPRGTRISAGLAATSHDPTIFNEAIFDSVSVTPSGASVTDIAFYGSDVARAGRVAGAWQIVNGDPTSPEQVTLLTPDNGFAALDAPLANPSDYLEFDFEVPAPAEYHLWLRLLATNNLKSNDSVWVQFSNATINGAPAYRIGSTDALLVNLEDCSGCGLSGWGFQDRAWWLSQSPIVTLPAGHQTIRIQVREDGAMFDEFVLSPSRYMTTAPGPVKNSTSWVVRPR